MAYNLSSPHDEPNISPKTSRHKNSFAKLNQPLHAIFYNKQNPSKTIVLTGSSPREKLTWSKNIKPKSVISSLGLASVSITGVSIKDRLMNKANKNVGVTYA